jgi:hypothetical protein
MKQASKVLSFFVFPIIIFVLHSISLRILNLYAIFPNLDIPFHYFGGLSIAYASALMLSYMEEERLIPIQNKVISFVLILSVTATVAVFWEFAEFLGDTFLNMNLQGSIANTMQDQFLGILGGLTWAVIYSRRPCNNVSYP